MQIKKVKVKVKSLSHVRLFVTPWTVAYQTSPSMEFSRQEYWSGLPFPSSGYLPDPGIEPRSPTLQADRCFTIWATREAHAGQEATVKTGHGTMDWFQIGKGVRQGCILSPCLFHFYAKYIMRNARLNEAQAGIKVSGRNINNFRYADDTTLISERKEEQKSLLMKVKEESEKNWLITQHSKNEDHGIWSHHFMANWWGTNGNSDKTLFSWAPKSLQMVTAAMKWKDTCSLEEKLWQT